MKNVLVLVHDDESQEARLQTALDLTRDLTGHLTCLDVAVMPEIAGGYDYGASDFLLADEHKQESANRKRLEQRLTRECVVWDWIDITGAPADCLTKASTLADIIVLNRHVDKAFTIDMQRLAGEVIIASRKPVLAVPDDVRAFDLGGDALVAWDGSDEATAALRGAIPLLKLARRVTIIQIDDGSIQAPADGAATYLSRHGIKAEIRIVKPGAGQSTAQALLDETQMSMPAYVVMGGFGHARWLEALTGGASHRMLREAPVPVLFGH